jgi:hypothetical protein
VPNPCSPNDARAEGGRFLALYPNLPFIDLADLEELMPRPLPSRRGGARTLSASIALITPTLAAACFAACTASPPTKFDPPGAGNGTGGNGGQGGDLFGDAGPTTGLAVTPDSPILTLNLPVGGQGVQFSCVDRATGKALPSPKWQLSSPSLGTLSSDGFFTPSGTRVGSVEVVCAAEGLTAGTPLKVVVHAVNDSANTTPEQKEILRGEPGLTDSGFRYLYPYDKTVFPRGVLAPEVHIEPGSVNAKIYYVRAFAPDVQYEAFLHSPGYPYQFSIPQDAWEALSNAAAGSSIELQVAKLAGDKKYGPLVRTLRVAKGDLHGVIYYNAYDSLLASSGAIMRIKGNSVTPEVAIGNCTVCHSVASDGSTIAASGGNFDMTGVAGPVKVWQSETAVFAALYPKGGTVLVTNGGPSSGNGLIPGTMPGLSELRTREGKLIPNSGVELFYAQSPVFSHDGKHLAFTDRQGASPYASTLSMFAYDAAEQKFSDYEVLGIPQSGHHYSWPAFTPDNRFVVFQDGVGDDLATWNGNAGRLLAIDVQNRKLVDLARLNAEAYAPAGKRDLNYNFEPTLAPVASGGFFWVMFTSRRTYGNKLIGAPELTKRLWISALDIDPEPGKDFSHPAFYVPGQEATSGNSRGFWALDPCKAEGTSCVTGDECCQGGCNASPDASTFVCGPPGECSDEYEVCETSADCCDPSARCIGGKCTLVVPT